MATTGYEPEDFLKEHIPYRLDLLDTYCTAILLGSLRESPVYSIGHSFVLPTAYGLRESPTNQLLNLAYESGLITIRLLMEFLGIKANKNGTTLCSANPRETDFHISAITCQDGTDLQAIIPSDISRLGCLTCSALGLNLSFNVEANLARIYRQANRTAAHLVTQEREFHGLDNYLACLVLRSLIDVAVYDRLNQREHLENLGVWSKTLLHDDILREHQRACSVVLRHVKRGLRPL